MHKSKQGIPILVQLMTICLAMTMIVAGGVYFYLLPMLESELLNNETHHSQDLVESVHSLVNDYYQRAHNREFDEDEARKRALKRIQSMRYSHNGYFWVNDFDSRMLMHPIMPELVGRDLSNLKDVEGKLLFKEFIKVSKNSDGGFVRYKWPEPGLSKPVDKISYVKAFTPWGWVIGTGLYTSVIDRSLASLRHDLLAGTVGIVAVLVIINIIIAIRISAPINRLSTFSARLKDDLTLKASAEGCRETIQLARALNNTTEELKKTLVSRDSLDAALTSLKEMQQQIIQSEKMASIGQLAAGVAHEINNPMGFINSNLATLKKYTTRIAEFLGAVDENLRRSGHDESIEQLAELRRKMKIDHVILDTAGLIDESIDGAERVKQIVQNLKSFSRVDEAKVSIADINDCLESTINIAWNEIKYVATLNRDFGELPDVVCFPQQLNQVFLNLLVNAAHSIEGDQGVITVRSWSDGDHVFVSVADTGCGIPPEIRQRIFEPFFTTKEAGKGTGLGLSISYDIIRKHGGELSVESEIGKGTVFTVKLPVRLTKTSDQA
jgi:signal transduction histidine kinase